MCVHVRVSMSTWRTIADGGGVCRAQVLELVRLTDSDHEKLQLLRCACTALRDNSTRFTPSQARQMANVFQTHPKARGHARTGFGASLMRRGPAGGPRNPKATRPPAMVKSTELRRNHQRWRAAISVPAAQPEDQAH